MRFVQPQSQRVQLGNIPGLCLIFMSPGPSHSCMALSATSTSYTPLSRHSMASAGSMK
jgi:hypothetical protein